MLAIFRNTRPRVACSSWSGIIKILVCTEAPICVYLCVLLYGGMKLKPFDCAPLLVQDYTMGDMTGHFTLGISSATFIDPFCRPLPLLPSSLLANVEGARRGTNGWTDVSSSSLSLVPFLLEKDGTGHGTLLFWQPMDGRLVGGTNGWKML